MVVFCLLPKGRGLIWLDEVTADTEVVFSFFALEFGGSGGGGPGKEAPLFAGEPHFFF